MQRKRGHRIDRASVQHCCFMVLCCCCCYLECWYPFKRQRERETEGKTKREQQAFSVIGASVSVSVLPHRLTWGSSSTWATLLGFVILQGPIWAEQYWYTFGGRGTSLWVTGPQQKPRKGTVASLFPPILVNSAKFPLLLLISCSADCPIQICVDYLFLGAFPSFLSLGTVCG